MIRRLVVDMVRVDDGTREGRVAGLHRGEVLFGELGGVGDVWTHGPTMYAAWMDRKSNHQTAFPRRSAAAARTRAALIRAASELFVEQGYVATTVSAIAERAGVARATLFTSVPGGKPELLKTARDQAIAGDDTPVPIPQRPWFLEAMAATDPATLIRLQARNYRAIHERAALLEQALVVGAAEAPELADLLEETQRQRAAGCRFVVTRLIEMHALPANRKRQAADTIYAIASPEVFLQLTRDRGWKPARYQTWLGETLFTLLVNADAGEIRRR